MDLSVKMDSDVLCKNAKLPLIQNFNYVKNHLIFWNNIEKKNYAPLNPDSQHEDHVSIV